MRPPPAPFKKGDRIRLVNMPNDPNPIEPDSTGTVINEPVWFEPTWQITVAWDNGRGLNLCVPPDVAVLLD